MPSDYAQRLIALRAEEKLRKETNAKIKKKEKEVWGGDAEQEKKG